MLKNYAYYQVYASVNPPSPETIGYWADLTANAKGNIIKFFDRNINRWVKLTDASSEYAVTPYIGLNHNWFVENRDTGIPATGAMPKVEDGTWWIWDVHAKEYVDTGVSASGLKGDTGNSAYDIAVENGFVGSEEEWIDSLKKPAEDAAEEANIAIVETKKATVDAVLATANAEHASESARQASIDAKSSASNADQAAVSANTATETANATIAKANEATVNAKTATTAAESASSRANTSADKADVATVKANTATVNADKATENTNIAILEASNAAQEARDAAANVKDGVDGKTPVINEINTTTLLPSNPASFKLIKSEKVDEHGNPIYNGEVAIPMGEYGKSPKLTIGTTSTGDVGSDANVSIIEEGVSPEGNPIFKLNFTIPRGATGEPGDGSGNMVAVNFSDTLNNKQYALKPSHDGSLNYILEEIEIPETNVDFENVMYISPQGNDNNSGKNPQSPKQSLSSAISSKVGPTVFNLMNTQSISFTENFPEGCTLYGPNTTYNGTLKINGSATIILKKHVSSLSSESMIILNKTSTKSIVNYTVEEMDTRNKTGYSVIELVDDSIDLNLSIQNAILSINSIFVKGVAKEDTKINLHIGRLELQKGSTIFDIDSLSSPDSYIYGIIGTITGKDDTKFASLTSGNLDTYLVCSRISIGSLNPGKRKGIHIVCPNVDITSDKTAENIISGEWSDILNKPDFISQKDLDDIIAQIPDTSNFAKKVNLNVGEALARTEQGVGEANQGIYMTSENVPGSLVLRDIEGSVSVGSPVYSNSAANKEYVDGTIKSEIKALSDDIVQTFEVLVGDVESNKTDIATLKTDVNNRVTNEHLNTQLSYKGSKLETTAYSVPYNSTSAVGEPTGSLKVDHLLSNGSVAKRTDSGQIRAADGIVQGDVVTVKQLEALPSKGVDFSVKDIAIAGSQKFNNKNNKVYNNVIDYVASGAQTGAVLIKLPVGINNSHYAFNLKVWEYGYSVNNVSEFTITAINYTGDNTWRAPLMTIIGSNLSDKLVRLGYIESESKCCLIIGLKETKWNSPRVVLERVTVIGEAISTDLSTGWTSELITDDSNISKIVTPVIVSRTLTPSEIAKKLTVSPYSIPCRYSETPGEPDSELAFSQAPTADTIVRRTSTAQIRVADATSANEAVSLGQMDAFLKDKSNRSKHKELTLSSTKWNTNTVNGKYYTYTVLDNDILQNVVIDLDASTDDDFAKFEEFGFIPRLLVSDGQFVIRSKQVPLSDIKIIYAIKF